MQRFNQAPSLALSLTLTALALAGALLVSGCGDKTTPAPDQNSIPEQSPVQPPAPPAASPESEPPGPVLQPLPISPQQGMRAYVDPVTGEYLPAPPPAPPAPETTEPADDLPGAALTLPVEPPVPEEIPLPQGGVMIELGDQFQTQEQAPAK
ncbi:MAG: hypothetical protein R6X06_06905 [Gammaproteobacteria bacterium]